MLLGYLIRRQISSPTVPNFLWVNYLPKSVFKVPFENKKLLNEMIDEKISGLTGARKEALPQTSPGSYR